MTVGGVGYKKLMEAAEKKHQHGYWGNHGNKNGGCLGYIIVAGIIIVAFLFLLILHKYS